MFMSVVLLVVFGLHLYFWLRLVHDTAMPTPWRRLATAFVVLLGLSLPVGMIASHLLPLQLARPVSSLPYVWMGSMGILFFLLLVPEVARVLARVLPVSPMDPERRLLLARVIGVGAAVSTLAIASVAMASVKQKLPVVRVAVALDKLAVPFEGYRIVQLTDLHIGASLDKQWLAGVVEQTLAIEPDIVVITGDLVDGVPSVLLGELEPLKRLTERHRVLMVTGNHEYYSDALAWLPHFKGLGLEVLSNEHVVVEKDGHPLVIAGVNDYGADRIVPEHASDVFAALRGAPEGVETVLLAHQPRSIHDAAAAGIGLVLSGHTHGGQIWPWSLLVPLQQPYVKGLHRHGENTQIYVSQGTGYWGPPMRLGTSSEITLVELKRADDR
jgi:predicted MPP superfamily phosphohydrolase